MTDHHATSSCSEKSSESTKPAYKEIEQENERCWINHSGK